MFNPPLNHADNTQPRSGYASDTPTVLQEDSQAPKSINEFSPDVKLGILIKKRESPFCPVSYNMIVKKSTLAKPRQEYVDVNHVRNFSKQQSWGALTQMSAGEHIGQLHRALEEEGLPPRHFNSPKNFSDCNQHISEYMRAFKNTFGTELKFMSNGDVMTGTHIMVINAMCTKNGVWGNVASGISMDAVLETIHDPSKLYHHTELIMARYPD
jgi:hypothetical protein